MIELKRDALEFSFPEVHPEAKLSIEFQRTLRIPDDGRTYPLPPGLGAFPLRHVDDFAERVPRRWIEHGGVMLPMYQAEAMWLNFSPDYLRNRGAYCFAIKIATGKINAVSAQSWSDGLHRGPQDYLVAPKQPWLDGYCVQKGVIRQFVAMPMGAGYTAEEQLTGAAEHGGVQIIVYPMKREVFERRFPERDERFAGSPFVARARAGGALMDMGLAPGGRMKQKIYDDPFDLADWETQHSSRCFVHLCNSMIWRSITRQAPPTVPPTAREYTRAKLPWFDYYAEGRALEGAKALEGLKSVATLGNEKGDVPLPENESVEVENIKHLREDLAPGQVREGTF